MHFFGDGCANESPKNVVVVSERLLLEDRSDFIQEEMREVTAENPGISFWVSSPSGLEVINFGNSFMV